MDRHRGLVAWQLANQYKKALYELATRPRVAQDRSYADHLKRTAASVELNIVEGAHRPGPADFARFLSIAIASLAEADAQVTDGMDRGHFVPGDLTEARTLARRTHGALAGLRRAVMAKKG